MPILCHCHASSSHLPQPSRAGCGQLLGPCSGEWFYPTPSSLVTLTPASPPLPPIEPPWREARCDQGGDRQVGRAEDPRLDHDVATLGLGLAQPPSLTGGGFFFLIHSPLFSARCPSCLSSLLVFALKAWPRKGRLSTFHNITAHFFLLFTSKITSSHI